jgi:hypothetical protein
MKKMSTTTPTRTTKPLPPVVAEIQRKKREKYEQDARDSLARMHQREEDERFDFAYDPFTSTLRYRVRLDQANDTDWQQAYATAQRVAKRRGAQVSNVRWGKDFWMCELTEVVSHPQQIS